MFFKAAKPRTPSSKHTFLVLIIFTSLFFVHEAQARPTKQCLSQSIQRYEQSLKFEASTHPKYKHSWNFKEINCNTKKHKNYDSCVRRSNLPPSSNFKIHKNKNSSTAALFLHGLSDSAYTMGHFAFALTRSQNIDAYGITLSGHDVDTFHRTKFNALTKSSFLHWISDLFYTLDKLKYEKGYKKILIVGHSTGALLALYAALKPCIRNMINGIALLSPPMNFIKGSPIPAVKIPENISDAISYNLFCKTFPSEKKLSKLKKPKSLIRYKSPNANSLCQVLKLREKVFQLVRQNHRIKVPTLYVGTVADYSSYGGDNLIDHNVGAQVIKNWLSPNLELNQYLLYANKSSGHAGFLVPKTAVFSKGQPDLTGQNHHRVFRRLKGFFNIVINNICVHRKCLNF